MTPLHIAILLHYQLNKENYNQGNLRPLAIRQCLLYLIDKGFLVCNGSKGYIYETTHKAAVFIYAICNLPHPKQTWTMP